MLFTCCVLVYSSYVICHMNVVVNIKCSLGEYRQQSSLKNHSRSVNVRWDPSATTSPTSTRDANCKQFPTFDEYGIGFIVTTDRCCCMLKLFAANLCDVFDRDVSPLCAAVKEGFTVRVGRMLAVLLRIQYIRSSACF